MTAWLWSRHVQLISQSDFWIYLKNQVAALWLQDSKTAQDLLMQSDQLKTLTTAHLWPEVGSCAWPCDCSMASLRPQASGCWITKNRQPEKHAITCITVDSKSHVPCIQEMHQSHPDRWVDAFHLTLDHLELVHESVALPAQLIECRRLFLHLSQQLINIQHLDLLKGKPGCPSTVGTMEDLPIATVRDESDHWTAWAAGGCIKAKFAYAQLARIHQARRK